MGYGYAKNEQIAKVREMKSEAFETVKSLAGKNYELYMQYIRGELIDHSKYSKILKRITDAVLFNASLVSGYVKSCSDDDMRDYAYKCLCLISLTRQDYLKEKDKELRLKIADEMLEKIDYIYAINLPQWLISRWKNIHAHDVTDKKFAVYSQNGNKIYTFHLRREDKSGKWFLYYVDENRQWKKLHELYMETLHPRTIHVDHYYMDNYLVLNIYPFHKRQEYYVYIDTLTMDVVTMMEPIMEVEK